MAVLLLNISEQAGRDYNQDRVLWLSDDHSGDCLLVVADGVGGTAQGELAAQCLIDTAAKIWQQRQPDTSAKDLVEQLFKEGNAGIALLNQSRKQTASTLVAVAVVGSECHSVHAGDSRLYHCRDGVVLQHTHDHSLAYAKFKLGEITEAEIATHAGQTQLLNCMTGADDVHAEYQRWEIQPGDHLLLCTDGFWEIFSAAEIAALGGNDNRAFVVANRLDDTLQQQPRHDNTSALMVLLGQDQVSMDEPLDAAVNQDKKTKLPSSLFHRVLLAALVIIVAVIAYVAWIPSTKEASQAPLQPSPQQTQEPEVIEPSQQEPPQQAPQQSPQQDQQQSEPPLGREGEQDDQQQQAPGNDAPQSDQRQGDSNDPTIELNKNLQVPVLDTPIETDNQRADTEVLQERFREDGLINEQSELNQTGESKDPLAHIITVQLEVHGTPVYGAVLRYRRTGNSMVLLSGRLAYLETMPSSPTETFSSCFQRYQAAQLAAGQEVAILRDATPTLYIDPASSQYFWAIDVVQTNAPSLAELHLLDNSCSMLRQLDKVVAG